MPEAVITELTIDSSGAEKGAATFADAMAKAQAAANDNLKSIAENTAMLNAQMGTFGQTTADAMEKSSFSVSGFVTKLAVGAAAAALGVGALYTAFKVLYEIVTFIPGKLAEAWELGNAKLAEYVSLAQKASDAGVSTDFYQRMTKAAEGAKLPVDQLIASFKTLASVTQEALGTHDAQGNEISGSAGQARLNQLLKAGNFQGNSGVNDLAAANSTESKFQAITNLIDQAMQKGERLAALDVAKTFLGPDVARNLAADSDYLDKIVASAAKIAVTDLVPDQAVANALDLQNRYDAAVKILEVRWHPIQDILTAGGIEMKSIWVGIVEAIATAFDWLSKMADTLAGRLYQGARDFLSILSTGFKEAQGPAYIDPAAQLENARQRLSAGLQNPATVAQAASNTNNIQNTLKNSAWADQSKTPGADAADAAKDAYDRAEESLRRYSETTLAAAKSIDMTTEAQERLKAIAQLTAAGMKDGLTRETATAKAEMSGLADQAARAAGELAKAQVQSQIKFGANTALLSQQDVQIASQLRGLYPDVATALGSVEANAIRTNAAFRSISTTVETNLTTGLTDAISGAKGFGAAMQDTGKLVVRALEEMIVKLTIIQPLMQGLQGFLGGGLNLSSAGFNPIAGATGSANGNAFDRGNVIPFATGGIIDGPTVTPMALMGEAGPEAIVPLRRGADGNLGIASAGGGGQVIMQDNRTIHVGAGASNETVAQLQAAFAQDRQQRYADTVKIVADARSRGSLR